MRHWNSRGQFQKGSGFKQICIVFIGVRCGQGVWEGLCQEVSEFLGTSKQDKNTYLQKCYKYQCPSIYDKGDLYRSSSEFKKSSDRNQKFTSVICLCSYVLSASIARGRVRHRRLKADCLLRILVSHIGWTTNLSSQWGGSPWTGERTASRFIDKRHIALATFLSSGRVIFKVSIARVRNPRPSLGHHFVFLTKVPLKLKITPSNVVVFASMPRRCNGFLIRQLPQA